MKLPLEMAIAATGATLLDAERAPATFRIRTDTRNLEPDDAFLALRGEQFDGHAFAAEAVRKGASLLVLDDPLARVAGVATMVVEQTERAYLALAGCARQLFKGSVVGITGSTGKTTTKSLLAQLCAGHYGGRVLASPANENNEIGVGRILLGASNAEHDVVIAEMGARRYGDIAILVGAAEPQIGILTNVGEAHLEIMGSRERLAETKWALFSRGARAILNACDDVSRERAGALPQPPHWFAAVSDGSALAELASFDRLTAVVGERRLMDRAGGVTANYEIDAGLPGLHNRANLAAAIAGALQLGVPCERVVPAAASLELPPGRYDRIQIAGRPPLIYDAYNANASAMIAALDAFAGEPAARRIAVLASMAELGEESQGLHERVGAHAAARVDILLVSGEFASALARGAQRAGLDDSQIVPVESNAAAAAWLRENARRDDVVLLKGSRKYKLEEIVEELRA
jgi:UDP-N-acetylmuramoyl-tripeptide--D-alanyl-D-alanine ligase